MLGGSLCLFGPVVYVQIVRRRPRGLAVAMPQLFASACCHGGLHALQERIVTRSRDATGQIQTHERNVGLAPDSAAHFDSEWVQHAGQVMPSWMNPGSGAAQQLQGPGRQQQQLALPPSGIGQQQQQQTVYGGGAAYQQRDGQQHYQQQAGQYDASGRRGGSGSGGWSGGYHV